jgi:hypothetical protein
MWYLTSRERTGTAWPGELLALTELNEKAGGL